MSNGQFDCDVIVAGAGLSGLACAEILINAGLEVMVLEASHRIGGRIHSLRDQNKGAYLADLGPSWVWPEYQPLIGPWFNRLSIDIFDQYEKGDGIFDLGSDQPVHRQHFPRAEGIKRIAGGPQTLVDVLHGKLPPACVRTGHIVKKIESAKNGLIVTVRVETDPQVRSFKARKVVMAIPLRLACEGIDWSSGLDPAVLDEMTNTPTWMATQAKMVAVYDNAFWRKNGLSGRIVAQSGPLAETHDHSSIDGKRAALFGFIGWPHEMRQSRASDLNSEIVAQLIRCFGKQAGDMRSMHIEDWATNDLICSSLDLTTSAAHPNVMSDILRAPHYDNRLFFSVAESSEQSPGLIEGALASARSIATQLITTL